MTKCDAQIKSSITRGVDWFIGEYESYGSNEDDIERMEAEVQLIGSMLVMGSTIATFAMSDGMDRFGDEAVTNFIDRRVREIICAGMIMLSAKYKSASLAAYVSRINAMAENGTGYSDRETDTSGRHDDKGARDVRDDDMLSSLENAKKKGK